jgi:plastocyanin
VLDSGNPHGSDRPMHRVVVSLLAFSLAASLAAPLAAGTLRGRVEMLEKKGKKAKDLSEVVVWVEGPKVAPPPARATINMRKKRFEPPLVVVPVGGEVAFPNMDPILHNAFSVTRGNSFDLDLYKKPNSRSHVFRTPGIVRVYCNIHPQMSAFVVVRDNPFWAQASSDGRFTIADVPAGRWVVKAWHARSGEISQDVQVTEAGVVDLALTLDASRYKRARHRNKYGKRYKKGTY